MRVWQCSGSVQLMWAVVLGGWGGALVSPAWAQADARVDEGECKRV